MPELDRRKQAILQAIIIEYITAAEPIGSEMLVQKYDLGVKSATVRNEMAEMSELGFLEQPHTSAGRIPSDLGYRYYVDRLVVNDEPSEPHRNRVKDTLQVNTLQEMLRLTVRALSRATQLLGAATTVRDGTVTVRAAVISALGPTQGLLVLALSNGYVENRMVECPAGLTLSDVGGTNALLQNLIVGQDLRSLSRLKLPSDPTNPATDKLIGVLWTQIRGIARDLTRGTLVTEGEEFMFSQPEFQRDTGHLSDLLFELVESDILYESIAPSEQGQPVTIGRENRYRQMQQLSVVRHSFYVGDSEAGVLALIGPTRMRYDVAIPLVGYTAQSLSTSLGRFFG